MNTTMFLPKEIKVGFQERGETYTGKLAYIVYIDEKGVVRKEKSFESWRNKKIETEQYSNEPMSGFVLNKKAGGYISGWNHRQTYVRVYDPRGFEFEISVENLLYILENTSSIIGKGLEGEFIYAWSGKDLILVPVNAPEYAELQKLNNLRHQQDFVKAKELKVGATYLSKDNEELVFLGKFDEYQYGGKKSRKQFYFVNSQKGQGNDYRLVTYASIARRLIQVIDEIPHEELEEMFENLKSSTRYSPIDEEKTKVMPMQLEDFLAHVTTWYFGREVVAENGKRYYVHINPDDKTDVKFDGELKDVVSENAFGRKFTKKEKLVNVYCGEKYDVKTLEDVFNILTPYETYYYLQNGRYHHKDVRNWNTH